MAKKIEPKKVAPTREDLVNKLKEIDTAIEETTNSATSTLKVVAVVAVVGVALLAFGSGRRRALRPKTVVSFTKLK